MKRTIVLVALLLAACASVSQKEKVVVTYQSVETALGSFQDAERALYAARTIPELTDARHQAISAQLAKAFDVQIRVGNSLLLWKVGEPAPPQVPMYFDLAAQIMTDVSALVPSNTKLELVAEMIRWAKAILELAGELNLPAPAAVKATAAGGVR